VPSKKNRQEQAAKADGWTDGFSNSTIRAQTRHRNLTLVMLVFRVSDRCAAPRALGRAGPRAERLPAAYAAAAYRSPHRAKGD